MIEFAMPALGADMDEGRLDEWRIKPGDTVTRGQIVAVVETTKAAVEIECWNDGVVDRLLVPVGETVAVGTPLATLLEPGEQPGTAPPPAPVTPAVSAPIGTEASAPQRVMGGAPVGHRLWVSPVARRTAASLGVDLRTIGGTGPQGAITLHDVERAAATAHHETPTPPPPPPPPAGATSKSAAERARERGAAMRASIAAAMSRSKREIPHYYLADEIILDTALDWLADYNAGRPITERMLPAVLQLKAVAQATVKFGEFNGFWRADPSGGDRFEPANGTHVGVAISLRGGGLVAPAIHDVAEKPLPELMADLTDLVARARAGSLRSSEMSDPTVTVTNLGEQGVDAVFGVIYPPQVAIVGFGRPAQRVVVVDGGIRVATTVHASLAADHRASDGARGALFLAEINRLLQQPHNL